MYTVIYKLNGQTQLQHYSLTVGWDKEESEHIAAELIAEGHQAVVRKVK